jgi:hydrogenase maturation protease
MPRGGSAGTLYVLEPDTGGPDDGPAAMETHGIDPGKALRLATAMGARVGRLLVVGCEPSPLADYEEMQGEMSEPVRAAVDEAVRLIETLAAQILGGAGEAVAGAGPRR